jgi:hypothetical protein
LIKYIINQIEVKNEEEIGVKRRFFIPLSGGNVLYP